MRRLGSRLTVVLVVAILATSCQYGRVGARCAPAGDWGHDETYLLRCVSGVWQRVMTLDEYGRRLRGEAQVLGAVQLAPPPPSPPGPAFRVVYAVPADAPARTDMGVAVRQELGIVDRWFAAQTGGRHLRFAPAGATVSVTSVRLPQTAAAIAAAPSPFGVVADAVLAAGLRSADGALLVYAQVRHPRSCGEGVARLAIVWTETCSAPSTSVTSFPVGSTFVAAHELVHALGAVPACAPHADGTGHVGDDPRDLMYQTPAGGPARDFGDVRLDPGRDDYFGHRRADCPDVALSPYWY